MFICKILKIKHQSASQIASVVTNKLLSEKSLRLKADLRDAHNVWNYEFDTSVE